MVVAMETCFKACLFPSLHLRSLSCHNSHIPPLPAPRHGASPGPTGPPWHGGPRDAASCHAGQGWPARSVSPGHGANSRAQHGRGRQGHAVPAHRLRQSQGLTESTLLAAVASINAALLALAITCPWLPAHSGMELSCQESQPMSVSGEQAGRAPSGSLAQIPRRHLSCVPRHQLAAAPRSCCSSPAGKVWVTAALMSPMRGAAGEQCWQPPGATETPVRDMEGELCALSAGEAGSQTPPRLLSGPTSAEG